MLLLFLKKKIAKEFTPQMYIPIFSYMKYRKYYMHVWNSPPYFHTWNIENSSCMKCVPIFSYMKYKKFYFHVWNMRLHFHRWNRKFYCYRWKSAPIFPYMKLKSPYFIYEICTYIIIHEIKKIVLIYEIRTWLGLLFHRWGLGSLGFHGWTVVGLKRPDRVPFIKWLNLYCLVWSDWDHSS